MQLIWIRSIGNDIRTTEMIRRIGTLAGMRKHIKVCTEDCYAVDKAFGKKEIGDIARLLTNPVSQTFRIHEDSVKRRFDWMIEIGFLPGVTDNVGNTAREIITDATGKVFKNTEGVYSSVLYYINGDLTFNAVRTLAGTYFNPIIQYGRITAYADYRKKSLPSEVPKVSILKSKPVLTVNLDIPDDGLIVIGKFGITNHDGTRRGSLALDLPYMKAIQAYFKKKHRQPTDIELESIAQTWSEHCKHTIFADPIDELTNGLYESYIKNATKKIRKNLGKKDFCVSVFTDNSGAIEFDDTYLVTHKVETHNSPSALDPFGGSVTGIVGVNRDAIGFGLGAKPIANTYGFCFADPSDTNTVYKDVDRKQPMLSPRRILDGVVTGVNTGGNCSGIPTPLGSIYFDDSFKGKPLVFVGTVGLIPKKSGRRILYQKQARPGDYIVMVGGRVGLDGIHGATFSSIALDSGSPATAVQIGDPITQKKLSDALVKEARDMNLFTSITDNGAGGLSCSVAEMAKESGGCSVNLDTVPLKYPGLTPWQIWISESQERMTLSVPKGKWRKLSGLLTKRGVEATVIGKFTSSGRCIVRSGGKKIMDIDMDFLHDGLPKRIQHSEKQESAIQHPVVKDKAQYTDDMVRLMARPNMAGYPFISMQYDHEVQGSSILKPLIGRGRVNADAAVIRPVLTSSKGIVLSQAFYPSYSESNPYRMAASTIDSAIRQCVATGADPNRISLLDNFCWCSSKDPKRLWQLKEAVRACYDTAVKYKTPFISGKDSMFNDFSGFDGKGNPVKISIQPTLLISALSVMPDVTKCVSLDFKIPGDLIYMVGTTFDEMGGSEYYHMKGINGGEIPAVDIKLNRKTYQAVYRSVRQSFIASAVSIGRGGMAAGVARSVIAGRLGCTIRLRKLPGKVIRNDSVLFSESQGRLLVTVAPENQKKFEKLLTSVPYSFLGVVTENPEVKISGISGKLIIDTDVHRLTEVYKRTFEDY